LRQPSPSWSNNGADALLAIADPFFIARRQQFVALAAACAKPAIYPIRWYPNAAG
jgi:hypothetical protein